MMYNEKMIESFSKEYAERCQVTDKTVSYTHLDVYKRQMHFWIQMRGNVTGELQFFPNRRS